MAPPDAWLARQNAALKLRAHGVTLDVSQGRVRLRATMPPPPSASPGTPPKQQRISTGLSYPDQATEALQMAELLGSALERHRLGIEPFDWNPWLPKKRGRPKAVVHPSPELDGITGREAIRTTRAWWEQQRRRGPSADDSWKVDYDAPLAPLQAIKKLEAGHLVALVEATTAGSRSRRRASQAAATVARALDWPEELVSQLRELGKGYSAARSQSPRELPRDEAIEALIDGLSAAWQWPVAVAATYGCRPHEALLFAEVQPSGLLRITDGKTGSRQSLALPAEWIERWSLQNKRLPAFNQERSHRDVGALMGQAFRRAGAAFQPYDLRHAWAVRAIHNPKISPSLAAKSMGHSLAVHSSVYQRWFDAHEMESLQAVLTAAS
ncbi:MAG: integrase [Vulcanococcus sp.]